MSEVLNAAYGVSCKLISIHIGLQKWNFEFGFVVTAQNWI